MAGEGGVAYTIAFLEDVKPEPPPLPEPTPVVTSCDKCNGTKKYKPDGKIEQPCPCGANCKCVGVVQKTTKQIILITEPSWCPPCAQMAVNVYPALKKNGWKFGENEHILVIGIDKAAELGYNIENIPTALLIEDGKIIAKHEGFLSGYGFGTLWAGRVDKKGNLIINQQDKTLYPYKAE